jgi:predicted enzyme related to lactoylglutathione lyase
VVHWEIVARDPVTQARFYRDLFSWDIGDGAIREVRPGLGGPEPGPGGHIRQGDTCGVVLYVQVRELRATLDRASRIGARITAEPFDLPGGPTIAFITDPEGNALGLVQA